MTTSEEFSPAAVEEDPRAPVSPLSPLPPAFPMHGDSRKERALLVGGKGLGSDRRLGSDLLLSPLQNSWEGWGASLLNILSRRAEEGARRREERLSVSISLKPASLSHYFISIFCSDSGHSGK